MKSPRASTDISAETAVHDRRKQNANFRHLERSEGSKDTTAREDHSRFFGTRRVTGVGSLMAFGTLLLLTLLSPSLLRAAQPMDILVQGAEKLEVAEIIEALQDAKK